MAFWKQGARLSKKSTTGIAIPKRDLDLIRERLAAAERDYEKGTIDMTRKGIEIEEGSGNVFADLGFANPEQEELRAVATMPMKNPVQPKAVL